MVVEWVRGGVLPLRVARLAPAPITRRGATPTRSWLWRSPVPPGDRRRPGLVLAAPGRRRPGLGAQGAADGDPGAVHQAVTDWGDVGFTAEPEAMFTTTIRSHPLGCAYPPALRWLSVGVGSEAPAWPPTSAGPRTPGRSPPPVRERRPSRPVKPRPAPDYSRTGSVVRRRRRPTQPGELIECRRDAPRSWSPPLGRGTSRSALRLPTA